MRKGLLIAFAVLVLILPVSGSHAAMIELIDLPEVIQPRTEGRFEFGVRLVDMGTLPNIDAFNFGLQISGADGLAMDELSVGGPDNPNYIFAGNTFAFSASNPLGNMTRMVVSDVTADGVGVENAVDTLLGTVWLSYGLLDPGTVLTFSIIGGDSFVESDSSTGYQAEDLVLTGRTTIPTPIPGTIWILGGGLMALLRFRRR